MLIISVVNQRLSYFNNATIYLFVNGSFLFLLFCIVISSSITYREVKKIRFKRFFIVLHIILILNIYFADENIQIIKNVGTSMYPTIDDNQLLIFRRVNISTVLKRGDIISFQKDGKLFNKRIFGIPHDEITISNGKICNKTYCIDDNYAKHFDRLKISVPNESYYVLGDNLANSKDSRYFDEIFVNRIDIKYLMLGIL
ncbi:signal peptidase I [Vibrio cholerae]|uniref:signal peptidase I n=2 Tax=Vibrio cholerae TaxID=666 RepID=UPI002AB5B80B|nr:signal peptidase I [Vibrio cholerae]MDY7587607.1 signal peptidase I [Vibrio cholerae]